MVRKLKYHEKKLLKKVDFLNWKHKSNYQELRIINRFKLGGREEYVAYNRIVGSVTKMTHALSHSSISATLRNRITKALVFKLFTMGIIVNTDPRALKNLTVTNFCQRRLSTLLVKMKFCENLEQAITYVSHGHVRIGPRVIYDPAVLVTRKMEDFITWSDQSKIRHKILAYRGEIDDYDMYN